MSVYVDFGRINYGRMKMCHMMADSIPELHAMAQLIGIKRKWFQPLSTPHYDICQEKRALAIKYGAIPVGRSKIVELIRKYKKDNKPQHRSPRDIEE